ncbi:hypothetical protein N7541_008534 [Penicillium brevicompactum]|uniref:Uncharacterized protein n=1 Tax=Penicillium brevicompactum TaxID=5074 RepID=A0A9W9QZA1_PENBR|nr:hypothetical protein N7541_008534 [Penicillium brevicompactum]
MSLRHDLVDKTTGTVRATLIFALKCLRGTEGEGPAGVPLDSGPTTMLPGALDPELGYTWLSHVPLTVRDGSSGSPDWLSSVFVTSWILLNAKTPSAEG